MNEALCVYTRERGTASLALPPTPARALPPASLCVSVPSIKCNVRIPAVYPHVSLYASGLTRCTPPTECACIMRGPLRPPRDPPAPRFSHPRAPRGFSTLDLSQIKARPGIPPAAPIHLARQFRASTALTDFFPFVSGDRLSMTRELIAVF